MSQLPSDDLSDRAPDYVASALKSAVGWVPFAGSLLTEVIGNVVPNQRIDRLTKFAQIMEKKLQGMEQQFIRSQLNNEFFVDVIEEGLLQASRSLTDDRREHIANLIANSLSQEEIEFVEAKHLLRILGEINDIEVIWLVSYCDDPLSGIDLDEAFLEKHADVLTNVITSIQSHEGAFDKEALQDSYKQHLAQLGLLAPEYRIDHETGFPIPGRVQGGFDIEDYRITQLGSLLVRFIRNPSPQNQEN